MLESGQAGGSHYDDRGTHDPKVIFFVKIIL